MSDKIIVGFVVVAVALVAALLLDAIAMCFRSPIYSPSVVLEREHVAARSSYGTAVGADGKTHATSSYSPERWQVIVLVEGAAAVASTNRAQWAACDKGARVVVATTRSPLGLFVHHSIASSDAP